MLRQIWRPQGDSNPCYRRERVAKTVLWTVVDRDIPLISREIHVFRPCASVLVGRRLCGKFVGSYKRAIVARTVRNQKLDTRSARAKLPAKKSPYWVSLAPGCTLGYRKGSKGAVWLAKIVRDGMRRETTLGTADDVLDPDGVLAIGYPQAQAKAREWFEAVVRPATYTGPYTVREAVADYLDWSAPPAVSRSKRPRRASTPLSCRGWATRKCRR
jgi:hypothetical protein